MTAALRNREACHRMLRIEAIAGLTSDRQRRELMDQLLHYNLRYVLSDLYTHIPHVR